MHHPTDRIIHTTTFVTPVVEHWLDNIVDIRILIDRTGIGSMRGVAVSMLTFPGLEPAAPRSSTILHYFRSSLLSGAKH